MRHGKFEKHQGKVESFGDSNIFCSESVAIRNQLITTSYSSKNHHFYKKLLEVDVSM